MGTYATTTAMEVLLVGTSFDTATTALVSKSITLAENEINSKLAFRYDVGDFADAVPPQIESLTEQLAAGFFYRSNHRGSKDMMERAKVYLRDARDDLARLASGKQRLVDSSGTLIERRSNHPGVKFNTTDYANTFAEDDPTKWKVDSDKLENIRDERD